MTITRIETGKRMSQAVVHNGIAYLAGQVGNPGDDVTAFMRKTVPMVLRNRALRRLWTSKPVLANLDGLVDYADDYTGGGVPQGALRTSYMVGKGLARHAETLAKALEPRAGAAEETVARNLKDGGFRKRCGSGIGRRHLHPVPSRRLADAERVRLWRQSRVSERPVGGDGDYTEVARLGVERVGEVGPDMPDVLLRGAFEHHGARQSGRVVMIAQPLENDFHRLAVPRGDRDVAPGEKPVFRRRRDRGSLHLGDPSGRDFEEGRVIYAARAQHVRSLAVVGRRPPNAEDVDAAFAVGLLHDVEHGPPAPGAAGEAAQEERTAIGIGVCVCQPVCSRPGPFDVPHSLDHCRAPVHAGGGAHRGSELQAVTYGEVELIGRRTVEQRVQPVGVRRSPRADPAVDELRAAGSVGRLTGTATQIPGHGGAEGHRQIGVVRQGHTLPEAGREIGGDARRRAAGIGGEGSGIRHERRDPDGQSPRRFTHRHGRDKDRRAAGEVEAGGGRLSRRIAWRIGQNGRGHRCHNGQDARQSAEKIAANPLHPAKLRRVHGRT